MFEMDKIINPNTAADDEKKTANKIDLSENVKCKIIDAEREKERLKKEEERKSRGVLGAFFGNSENSSKNIAGFLIFTLLFIATFYTGAMIICHYQDTHSQVMDFWNVITPIITLSVGYLFGYSRGSDK